MQIPDDPDYLAYCETCEDYICEPGQHSHEQTIELAKEHAEAKEHKPIIGFKPERGDA